MTVDELIMLLETLPGDLPVHAMYNGYDSDDCPRVRSAAVVTLVDVGGEYHEADAYDDPNHGLPKRKSVLLGYKRAP